MEEIKKISAPSRSNPIEGFTLFEVVLCLVLVASVGMASVKTHYLNSHHERQSAKIIQILQIQKQILDTLCTVMEPSNYSTGLADPPSFSLDCRSLSCNSGELAAYLLSFWKCQIGSWDGNTCDGRFPNIDPLLPQGRLTISTSGEIATAVVSWPQAEGTEREIAAHAVFAYNQLITKLYPFIWKKNRMPNCRHRYSNAWSSICRHAVMYRTST